MQSEDCPELAALLVIIARLFVVSFLCTVEPLHCPGPVQSTFFSFTSLPLSASLHLSPLLSSMLLHVQIDSPLLVTASSLSPMEEERPFASSSLEIPGLILIGPTWVT